MTKEKPTLAVDIDDVIFPFVPGLARFHNERYGTNLEERSFTTWNLNETLGCTHDESVKEVIEYYNSDIFRDLEPYQDAMSVLSSLANNYLQISITARMQCTREHTLRKMSKYFPYIREIVFVNEQDKTKPLTKKSAVCLERGVSLMIEDSARNAISCADANIKVLLLSRPWNLDFKESGLIQRVNSWDEIARILQV